MKRTELKRKTPLVAKREPFRTNTFGGGQRVPKRVIRRRRPKASRAEQFHMNLVAAMGCIVCRHQGVLKKAALHHVRTGYGFAQRASHWEVLPLCPDHHQNGGFGMAFHAGERTWMAKFGTEIALLAEVYATLAMSLYDCRDLRGADPPWWPRFLDGTAMVSNAAEIFYKENDDDKEGCEAPEGEDR